MPPPICSTIFLLIASPRPVPSRRVFRPPACSNGSKMRVPLERVGPRPPFLRARLCHAPTQRHPSAHTASARPRLPGPRGRRLLRSGADGSKRSRMRWRRCRLRVEALPSARPGCSRPSMQPHRTMPRARDRLRPREQPIRSTWRVNWSGGLTPSPLGLRCSKVAFNYAGWVGGVLVEAAGGLIGGVLVETAGGLAGLAPSEGAPSEDAPSEGALAEGALAEGVLAET
jgi:hypothetical protein